MLGTAATTTAMMASATDPAESKLEEVEEEEASRHSSSSLDDLGLPTDTELTLLCLDHLRDLRRTPELLQASHAVHPDYLTIACWALQRAFTQPPLSHGNDAFSDADLLGGGGGERSMSDPLPTPLPSLADMELEVLLHDDDEDHHHHNSSGYEYDDGHPSNSHRFYSLGGLASGPSLRGPLTLGELVAAGLSGLGARSRRSAEYELVQSELFLQFVAAVRDKGFFQGGGGGGGGATPTSSTAAALSSPVSASGSSSYDDKFHKVVAKFRTKLAAKADAEVVGDLLALSAAEKHRKRRLVLAQREGQAATSMAQNLPSSGTGGRTPRSVPRTPSRATPTATTPHRATATTTPAAYAEADEEASVLSAENPADLEQAEHLKNEGNTHMQRKEFAEAAKCYTRALQLSPAGPHSHVYFSNRAAALVSMKKFHEAIADSERSLALKPDYGKAHARLGLAHFLLGNYRQSMEAYTVSLKYEPDNRSSKNYLEKAARRLAEHCSDGDAATGSATPTAATMTGSSNEPSYSVVSEGRAGSNGGSGSGDPESHADKYKTRGNQCMVARDYPSALQAYTRAVELSPAGPQSHVYYSNRAAALCYLERYRDAERDSLRSLQLVPTYGKAHARLGLSRFFLGDYVGAVRAYREALVHDPDNAASQSYLLKAQAKLQESQQQQQCV